MATKKTETPEVVGPGGVPIKTMEPSFDFTRSIQIWQGPPKVGKTSTAAALGPVSKEMGLEGIDPFLMLFERGSGGVQCTATSEKCECGGKKSCPDCEGKGVKRKILTTLEEIREWFEWVATSDYNPVVIDTTDAMFQTVADSVCVNMGIGNPSQADHGIAWMQIYDEMRELLAVLSNSGKAVIMLMHIYMQEKRVKGGSIQTATFNVSGKTKSYLAGLANQILHFHVVPKGDGDQHVIVAAPMAGVEAGDHWGVFPEELDRGDSPEEGAQAILSCFYEVE